MVTMSAHLSESRYRVEILHILTEVECHKVFCESSMGEVACTLRHSFMQSCRQALTAVNFSYYVNRLAARFLFEGWLLCASVKS